MSRFIFKKSIAHQAGFSLVELMISMVIGMVVVGAVMAAYLASGTSGRNGRALSQITEDASIVFSVLRSGISMVSYGAPTGVNGGRFTKVYTGPGLYGCSGKFSDASVDIDKLACAADKGPNAIAVAFEADEWNSVRKSGTTEPLDCLGNSFAKTGTVWVAYNRYYVDNNQLLCRGPGDKTAAALVDNVVDLQIQYGIARSDIANNPAEDSHRVTYYASADAIGGTPGSAEWRDRVVSVRVCVEIRSADNVLDESMGSYQGCAGQVAVDADDRHLYRMFTNTIVLQNRVGAVL